MAPDRLPLGTTACGLIRLPTAAQSHPLGQGTRKAQGQGLIFAGL